MMQIQPAPPSNSSRKVIQLKEFQFEEETMCHVVCTECNWHEFVVEVEETAMNSDSYAVVRLHCAVCGSVVQLDSKPRSDGAE